MKLSKLLMMAAVGATMFTACKKDETKPNNNGNNPPAKTKKDLLLDGKWQTIADSQTTSYMGVDTTIDAYAFSYADCGKDDFITFAANGIATRDEGVDKCSASDPQTENFDWALLNNDSQLMYTKMGEDDTFLMNILELNEKQIRLTDSYTESGVTYSKIMTMKNIK